MNSNKLAYDKKIEEYQQMIETEQRKVAEFSHDKKQVAQAKLDEVTLQYKEIEASIAEKQQQRAAAEQELITTRKAHEDLKIRIENARQDIVSTQSQLDLITQRERNKLAPFGNNMEHVLADIQRQQWHGRPPVGPLGRYVHVRDQAWAPVLRVRLGGLMSAFAITDGRDRKALDQILKRHSKYVMLFLL